MKNTVLSTDAFDDWLDKLKDRLGRIKILKRIESAEAGNWGDVKAIPATGGLWEMRINYGPGYRLHYGQSGNTVYLLIAGGSKRNQDGDIAAAKSAWLQIKEKGNDR